MSERRRDHTADAEGLFAAFVRNWSSTRPRSAGEAARAASEVAHVVGGVARTAGEAVVRSAAGVAGVAGGILATMHVPGMPAPGVSDDGEPREISEAGRMPGRRLEKIFERMTAMVGEGRFDEVRARLEELIARYPHDLLFLRQVAEFHLETGDRVGAIGSLFVLARRFFETHNLAGMREALEQILVLDPANSRAFRLLGLLDRRPNTNHGR